jgi:DNA-binding transcriptional LysR family regulator
MAEDDAVAPPVGRDLADRLLDGRLKLRHLVVLTMIAEHGTLSRSAEHLHVTQPVVTRAVQDLETILGVSLFDRGPRGMTPTVYGRAFVDQARTIVGQVRQAGRQITELADARSGTVRVGTHLAGSNLLLPRAIMRIKADRPRLTIVVREATPDVLLAALRAGDLDLTVGRITPVADGLQVRQETLYDEPIRLVTRVGHPAQQLAEPTIADLVDFPWIVPVEQTALRVELEHALQRIGVPLPQNRVECTSIPTLRTLLVESDFVAVLPQLVARADPDLALLSCELEGLRRPVGVTTVPGRLHTPACEAFLEVMAEVAAEVQADLERSRAMPV